jgi:hypothetical protein
MSLSVETHRHTHRERERERERERQADRQTHTFLSHRDREGGVPIGFPGIVKRGKGCLVSRCQPPKKKYKKA